MPAGCQRASRRADTGRPDDHLGHPGDGSLAIAWTAPSGSTVTSYDLRYIETAEDETVDANWTIESGIWTSGSLDYTLTGLDGEVSYDVQVRAVNAGTAGDWSATLMGTPLIGVPTISSVLAGDGALRAAAVLS